MSARDGGRGFVSEGVTANKVVEKFGIPHWKQFHDMSGAWEKYISSHIPMHLV